MIPGSEEKGHGKDQAVSIGDIYEAVLNRGKVPGIFGGLAVDLGVCLPKCGSHHAYRLANGRYQCTQCRHQVSVTAGTVLHKTHMPLTQWFLAFYFVCQDKRGISAVQLAAMIGTIYKTAWFMLRRIRITMGQRDQTHQLNGVIEFDDAYFGGPTAGKKRGRGTEKEKVFVALSLDELGNPRFLKMRVTPNLKQASVKKFARAAFADNSVIHSDGYRSYIPALEGFSHEHRSYDPDSGLLHCSSSSAAICPDYLPVLTFIRAVEKNDN